MKVDVDLLSATEASTILRVKLGTLKAWPSFLADCIRERQSLCGQRLMPWASLHTVAAEIGRPMYRREDVDTFVSEIKRIAGITGPGTPIRRTRVTVDDTPGLPWRFRRAERVKAMLAPLRSPVAVAPECE